jgi:hypothetical protein
VLKTLLWGHSEKGGNRSKEFCHEAGTSNFEVQTWNQRSYKDRKLLFIDESTLNPREVEALYIVPLLLKLKEQL